MNAAVRSSSKISAAVKHQQQSNSSSEASADISSSKAKQSFKKRARQTNSRWRASRERVPIETHIYIEITNKYINKARRVVKGRHAGRGGGRTGALAFFRSRSSSACRGEKKREPDHYCGEMMYWHFTANYRSSLGSHEVLE